MDRNIKYTDSEIEELKRKAIDNDITALCALECCGEWCIEESKYESITTKELIGQYLFSLSDNDNALCLSSAFKYGILVKQDKRMAELLGRAKNISVTETADDGYQYGYLDTDIFEIDFTDEEKDYFTKQIENIAETVPELRRDALYCLTDIYTHYYSSGIAKQRKRNLFIQIYNEYHEESLLDRILNCVPKKNDEKLYWLKPRLKDVNVEQYAKVYQQYANQYPTLYSMIAHLYEYGFCCEDVTPDNNLFQMAHVCRSYDDAKFRSRYVCEEISKGNLLAMAFLDNDPFLMEETPDVKVSTLQFLDKQISKSGITAQSPLVHIFLSLCEQYANLKRGTENAEIKALVNKYIDVLNEYAKDVKSELDINELPLPKHEYYIEGSCLLLNPDGTIVEWKTISECENNVIDYLNNIAAEFHSTPDLKIKIALQFYCSPATRGVDKDSIHQILKQIPSDAIEVVDWGFITDGTDMFRYTYLKKPQINYLRIFEYIPLELCFRSVSKWLEYNEHLLERICEYIDEEGTKEDRRRYLDVFYSLCENGLLNEYSLTEDYVYLAEDLAKEYGESEHFKEMVDLVEKYKIESFQKYEQSISKDEDNATQDETAESDYDECPF